MELIYIWVEDYKNIKQTGFHLSSNYRVQFDDEYSRISIEPSNNVNIFPNPIHTVTALIGQNGCGKTNILDLLGYRYTDRKSNDGSYFILYHHEGNKFCLEGNKVDFLDRILINLDEKKITDPYSIEVELLPSGKLEFLNFLNIEEELVHYFNYRQNFKNNYSRSGFQIIRESTPFFQRFLLQPSFIGSYAKYLLITNYIQTGDSKIQQLYNSGGQVNLVISNNLRVGYDEINFAPKVSTKTLYPFKIDSIKVGRNRTLNSKENKENFVLNLMECYLFSNLSQLNDEDSKVKLADIILKLNNIEDISNVKSYYRSLLKITFSGLQKKLSLKNPTTFIDRFFDILKIVENISPEYFHGNEIVIKIADRNEILSELLQEIDKSRFDELYLLQDILGVNIGPTSDGEEAFINLYSALHFGLSWGTNSNKETAIILLDEPDSFMHPEWSRNLLTQLFSRLADLPYGYKKYQLVLSTHSPFIVSDLPIQCVIPLRKGIDGCCTLAPFYNKEQTFASNIHTLLSNEFFMKATMGQFSVEIINEVLNQINLGTNMALEKQKWTRQVINLIGEPMIKQKLWDMFLENFPELKKESIKGQIERLQAQLDEMRNENG